MKVKNRQPGLWVLGLLLCFSTAQAQNNATASWTGLLQRMNQYIAGRSTSAPTYDVAGDNELDRGILYAAIQNYSLLFLDSNVMIHPAGNGAAREHIPDYRASYPNYQIGAIRSALARHDGLALATALSGLHDFHDLSDNYYRRYIYSDPYLPVLEDDAKAFSKAWDKLHKNAEKGKLDALITLVDFYAEHKKGTISTADQQDFEHLFSLFLASPAIKNGTVPKSKPITQSMYVLAARFYLLDDFADAAGRTARLQTALKYLATADSTATVTNYTVDNKGGGSYPMDTFHDQSCYYSLVMQNSAYERILADYALAGLAGGKAESDRYANDIVDTYYRLGNDPQQQALFRDPLLQREFTNDPTR